MRVESFGQQGVSVFDKLIYFLRWRKIKPYINNCAVLVDMGCGYGAIFLRWALSNFSITSAIGLDVSFNSEFLKKSPDSRLRLVESDLNKALPLPNESADVVTSLAVLEHLNEPDFHLKEIYRTLKPGGKLVLTTPSPWAKPILEFIAYRLHIIDDAEIRDHKNYFNSKQLAIMFKKAGFSESAVKSKTFMFGLNNFVMGQK